MSKTPLTDKEEKFIYYEAFPASRDFLATDRSIRNREGYVSSEFARHLELRIQELESQLHPTEKHNTID